MLLTAAVAKFAEGAWVVVLAVPLLVLLFRRIHRHYDRLHGALALHSPPSAPPAECDELPQQVRHLVVVPVARLNRASLRALAYATSLGRPTLAVHIAPAQDEADRFRDQWRTWGDHLRLETIVSPYRSVIGPLAHYLEALHAASPDLTLTVIVPEVVLRRRRYRLLHSRAEQRLRTALRALPGVVVTSVPVHVSRDAQRYPAKWSATSAATASASRPRSTSITRTPSARAPATASAATSSSRAIR